MQTSKIQGVESRKKAYLLENFLNACKKHKELVEIDSDAQDEAVNVLHINSDTKEKIKDQILDQIALHGPEEFEYKNTKPFRKGINGDHPLVDAYTFAYRFIDVYIAFCVNHKNKGWFIKSLHSDGSHSGFGDSMSIGDMIKLIGNK